jgi:hypothetical protein
MHSAAESGEKVRSAANSVGEQGRPSTRISITAYDYLLFFVGVTSGAIILLVFLSLLAPVRALVIGALLTIAAGSLLRDQDNPVRLLFGRPDPWLIGCVLLALFLRENIATNYVGGQDPGAYVNFSGIIQHSGGMYFFDSFRNTLPDALKQLYDRAPKPAMAQIWPLGDGLRFQAAWYPLHPGWMAIFSGLFGADMHGLSMLMFSLLGVTGGYFLTQELAGASNRSAARLAAVLMAINPALCFLAKFPVTEAQTAALLLNAAYLLAKALKADGRNQLFLLASSLILVIAYFFTRLSFPILAVPWAALYVFSCSRRLDYRTAARLRAYLWLAVAASVLVGIFYYKMLPILFDEILVGTYVPLVRSHATIVIVAAIAFIGLNILPLAPIRSRLQPVIEFGISAVGRAALWLPLIVVVASVPGAWQIIKTGHLFSDIDVPAQLSGFRYHTIYRWMLAITPSLWLLLLALPALVKWNSALTFLLLFLGSTLALTEVFAPSLPYLYYHMRYISSEIVPFSLVIMSIVLAMMCQMPGRRRNLAIIALLFAIPFMGFFSAVQLFAKEGQDPLFFHELDQAIASEDVLLLGEDDGVDIGVPLRYFFNKQLFIIPKNATGEQVREIFRYFLNNSGSKYGRILLLSRGWGFRFLGRTVERLLIYKDTVITNSEHWRSGGFASHEPGRMILPYAWHTTNVPYSLERVNAVIQGYLPLGCPIDFSKGGNSELFVERGWSGQEEAYRWTDGPIAMLRLRLKQETVASHLLLLDFQAIPFGASQRTTVTVDGKQVAELSLTPEKPDHEIEVSLNKSDINTEHEIVFGLPDAHSPQSIGLNRDTRELGMAMRSLTIFDEAKTAGKCD